MSMKSKNRREPNAVTGRGYVGRWMDGTLGWCLPEHLGGYSRPAEPPSRLFNGNGQHSDRAVLCEITVRVVKDKLGREITRKAKVRE